MMQPASLLAVGEANAASKPLQWVEGGSAGYTKRGQLWFGSHFPGEDFLILRGIFFVFERSAWVKFTVCGPCEEQFL